MQNIESSTPTAPRHTPWNKGKLIGAKPPLRPKHVWSIRTKPEVEGRTRDLAMFNLAIDSKLRGCDVVRLKVDDIAPHGHAVDRAIVRQKKTGQPVRFELTEHTREALRRRLHQDRRLITCNEDGVTFRSKDYRADGRARSKRMTLATDEFIRRFLMHVLPKGFHRIRHYGLLARPSCADNIARARELLAVPVPQDHNADADAVNPNEPPSPSHPCPCCGGRMITIETFARGSTPRHRPTGPITAVRIDTS